MKIPDCTPMKSNKGVLVVWIHSKSVIMASENEEQMEWEARHIFLLMKREYRISRNSRAQWYFNHLNQVVNIPKAEKIDSFKGEIEIICAVPQDSPTEWDWDTSHLYQ